MNDSNHLVGGGVSAALVALADDGTPTTTSLVIAEGVGREHTPIVRLIREHLGDFEDFGPVGFENSPVATSGNAPDTYQTVAVLNEHQAVLLITFMRNIGIVKEFKKRLVAEFFAMRRALTTPAAPALTDDELIHQALVVSTKRTREMAELAGRLATKVAEQTPKVDAYDAFMESDGSYKLAAVAKMLGWGPNIMNRQLRQLGVLRRDNLPYQRYAHHFNVVPQVYTRPDGQVVPTATTYVLPTGVEFLRRKLAGQDVAEQPVTVAALPLAEAK